MWDFGDTNRLVDLGRKLRSGLREIQGGSAGPRDGQQTPKQTAEQGQCCRPIQNPDPSRGKTSRSLWETRLGRGWGRARRQA